MNKLVEAIESVGFNGRILSDSSAFSPIPSPSPSSSGSNLSHPKANLKLGHMGDTTSTFEVTGMTCGACVSAVEGALMREPGVVNASVALLTERAQIVYDSSATNRTKLLDVIEAAGYEGKHIQTRTNDTSKASSVTLRAVRDASTAAGIRQGRYQRVEDPLAGDMESYIVELLSSCAGIIAVEVKADSATQATVEVFYDQHTTGVRTIFESVSAAGYDVELVRAGADTNESELMQKQHQALKEMSITLLLAFAFTIPVTILCMVGMDAPSLMKELVPGLTVNDLLLLVLATPVQFISGWGFYVDAYHNVRTGSLGMSFLIALGTTAAYAFGLFAILHSIARGGHAQTYGDFFMTSCMLIAFVLLGKFLEIYARQRTSSAVSSLMSVAAKTAILLEIEGEAEIDPDTIGHSPLHLPTDQTYRVVGERTIDARLIQRGDVVKVVRGMTIPADGIITYGQGHADESLITGESLPQPKNLASRVIGGTTLHDGLIHVKITSVEEETILKQIVKLVQDAQVSKAPIQVG